jgi:hypothetical protein
VAPYSFTMPETKLDFEGWLKSRKAAERDPHRSGERAHLSNMAAAAAVDDDAMKRRRGRSRPSTWRRSTTVRRAPSFSFDKTSGQNGDVVNLTITALASDPRLRRRALHLVSTLGSVQSIWIGTVGS